MISDKDKKLLKIIGIASVVLVFMYLIHSVYTNYTGKLVTEFALNYTQEECISVEGLAIRDEGTKKGSKNSSFLYKNDNKTYVPLVDDSANVSKNDSIALAFSDEASAEAYRERAALAEKIDSLKQLKSQGGLSYLNVVGLNSMIYSSVMNYAQLIDSPSVEGISKVRDDLSQKITTKQLATGEKLDFNSAISAYEAEYDALEGTLGSYERISSPYAGYFVSSVDGYENLVSYKDTKDKKLGSKYVEALLNAEKSEEQNVYGKIVGSFIWYFVFDVAASEISSMDEGKTVYVNFPGKGLEGIKMTIYDISEVKDSIATVTLRCKLMNEELVTLRKEKAEIVLNKHNGFKINRQAIVKNDEGLDGVYVLSGNLVEFSPVDIKYYGEDYVIADKYYVLEKNKKGDTVINYDKTDSYRAIKLYDNIIVKGRNLHDGKIIG